MSRIFVAITKYLCSIFAISLLFLTAFYGYKFFKVYLITHRIQNNSLFKFKSSYDKQNSTLIFHGKVNIPPEEFIYKQGTVNFVIQCQSAEALSKLQTTEILLNVNGKTMLLNSKSCKILSNTKIAGKRIYGLKYFAYLPPGKFIKYKKHINSVKIVITPVMSEFSKSYSAFIYWRENCGYAIKVLYFMIAIACLLMAVICIYIELQVKLKNN